MFSRQFDNNIIECNVVGVCGFESVNCWESIRSLIGFVEWSRCCFGWRFEGVSAVDGKWSRVRMPCDKGR